MGNMRLSDSSFLNCLHSMVSTQYYDISLRCYVVVVAYECDTLLLQGPLLTSVGKSLVLGSFATELAFRRKPLINALAWRCTAGATKRNGVDATVH